MAAYPTDRVDMFMDLDDEREFPPLPSTTKTSMSMGGQSEKINLHHPQHPGSCQRLLSTPSTLFTPNTNNRMGWPENAVGLVHSGEIKMNVISPTIHQKTNN